MLIRVGENLLLPYTFHLVRGVEGGLFALVFGLEVHDVLYGLITIFGGLYFVVCRYAVLHTVRIFLRAGVAKLCFRLIAGSQYTGGEEQECGLSHNRQ